jgi:hypothetical protein
VNVTRAASAEAVNGPAAARFGKRLAMPLLLLRIVSPIKRSMATLLTVVVNVWVLPDVGTEAMVAAEDPSCTESVPEFVNPALVRTMDATGVVDVVIPENAGVILYEVA